MFGTRIFSGRRKNLIGKRRVVKETDFRLIKSNLVVKAMVATQDCAYYRETYYGRMKAYELNMKVEYYYSMASRLDKPIEEARVGHA